MHLELVIMEVVSWLEPDIKGRGMTVGAVAHGVMLKSRTLNASDIWMV